MGYRFTVTYGLRAKFDACIKLSNVDSEPIVEYHGSQNNYHSLPIKNYSRNHGGDGKAGVR